MPTTDNRIKQQLREPTANASQGPSLLWVAFIGGVPLLVAVAALSILAFK